MTDDVSPRAEIVGSCAVMSEIAAGAMGTVHLGKLLGPAGFSRVVAVKRMRPDALGDAELVAMFVDEARMAARVRHPNVVATLDVVVAERQLLVVMEYVHGASLLELLRALAAREGRVPPRVAASIVAGVLRGLHAAHEATTERGEPLELVHRDVSPGNVLVGIDGVARITDFGVAKAVGRLHATRDGSIKGKLAYMPPEQLHGDALDARVDVYAAGVVLWEALVGRPLFARGDDDATIEHVLRAPVPPPSALDATLAPFDAVVLRALSRARDARFDSAHAMAIALEKAADPASPSEVGAWVESVAGAQLAARARAVDAAERARLDAPGGAAAPADDARGARASHPERGRRASRTRALGALGALAVGAAVALLAARGAWSARAAPSPPPAGSTPPAPPDAPRALDAPPDAPRGPDAKEFSARPAPRTMDPAPAAPRTHHAPSPTPKVDCSQPFIIDADGHKHFKPACAP